MTFTMNFNHGDRVIVVDRHGNHEVRGVILGRYETRKGSMYDVQPHGELSLSARLVGIPEDRLRHMGISLVKGVA
ncbi:hypothetical protein R5W24_000516 [Gemmata sp. JC717]|uniref:hypothetical protein n=1 Tax=Gemmata algarum TaxID=2975278 RepID=UPI0021BADF9E|nr:hypothetical protein [Gemmata algarum]MDY3551440.1 hypothetical protein [Gemmata algarum]